VCSFRLSGASRKYSINLDLVTRPITITEIIKKVVDTAKIEVIFTIFPRVTGDNYAKIHLKII
jgi:hypothetical protein